MFFKAFFNLKPNQIKETVIISPIVYPKQFERIIGEKGKHYKSILSYLVANFKHITFIKTPMTQAAVSDAVILLEKTPCKRVVFIGAIGALQKGYKIGDIVVSKKAKDIYSVNSIHEETREKLLSLRKKGVMGIDFESRAFFSSVKKAKLSAFGYYVVTDLPLTKPFYMKKTEKEKNKIKVTLEEIICNILMLKRLST
jgi:purine-nucleoside phosphorylase